MKEMTTAEFAKVNLATVEEPVDIRRYTTVIGTYYPAGYDHDLAAANKMIAQLEADNRHLKQELAKRTSPIQATVAQPSKDVFAALPKQDREFFERKLGKKK